MVPRNQEGRNGRKHAPWSSEENAKRRWAGATTCIGTGVAAKHRWHQARSARHGDRRPLWARAIKGCCHFGRSHFGQAPWEKWKRRGRRGKREGGGGGRGGKEKKRKSEGKERRRRRKSKATSRTICPGWPQELRGEKRGRK